MTFYFGIAYPLTILGCVYGSYLQREYTMADVLFSIIFILAAPITVWLAIYMFLEDDAMKDKP